MKFIIENAAKFRDCVKSLAALTEYGTFRVSEGKLRSTLMDTTHVALIKVEWETPSVDADGFFSASLKQLEQVLSFAREDVIEIEAINDVIKIAIDGRKGEFELKQIDIDAEEMQIPEYETNKINVDRRQFADLIKQFATLGDTVTLEARDMHLKLSTEGDLGKASYTIETREPIESMKQRLSIRYVASFMKLSAEELTIELSEEMPACFTFRDHEFTVQFFLAPKIDDDEDMEADV